MSDKGIRRAPAIPRIPNPRCRSASHRTPLWCIAGAAKTIRTGIHSKLRPVWRYTAKDALESPGVPAVEVFRKLIADSEKQLAGP